MSEAGMRFPQDVEAPEQAARLTRRRKENTPTDCYPAEAAAARPITWPSRCPQHRHIPTSNNKHRRGRTGGGSRQTVGEWRGNHAVHGGVGEQA